MARRSKNRSTYRSGLEDLINDQLMSSGVTFGYESDKVKYTIPESSHTYTPDFTVVTKSGKTIYIETKGIWDSDDRKKHLLIRDQHPELDIRFVFQRSKNKIRKGSKTTYADVCEGRARHPFNGVVWKYSDKLIPQEWLEE